MTRVDRSPKNRSLGLTILGGVRLFGAVRSLTLTNRSWLFAVLGLCCSACGPNSDGSKLRELENLQQSIPVFQSFVETSVHKTSKANLAGITTTYKSDAAYDDVKQFYLTALPQQDWEYMGERAIRNWGKDFGGRTLGFRRGEYTISIFYSGDDPEFSSHYAIEMGWERPMTEKTSSKEKLAT